MYIPAKFKQPDSEEMIALMQANPFVTLISYHDATGLDAMHLPVVVEHAEDKLLIKGHMAKANPLWRQLDSESPVLVVFHGPHHYISPNYYPTKQQSGKGVPTWNYVVVHARGKVTFIHEANWLMTLLDALTDQHEASLEQPWSVADAPTGYIEKMLGAIVGFEIPVESVEGAWKLNQNQVKENQTGVMDGLADCPSGQAHDVVSMMRKSLEPSE